LVARNTVVLAYRQIVAEGFLAPHPCAGFVAAERIARPQARRLLSGSSQVAWQRQLIATPSTQRNITEPEDWQKQR